MSYHITEYYINQWEETPEDQKRETLKRLLMIRKLCDEEKAYDMIEPNYLGAYISRESFIANYASEKYCCFEELETYIDLDGLGLKIVWKSVKLSCFSPKTTVFILYRQRQH